MVGSVWVLAAKPWQSNKPLANPCTEVGEPQVRKIVPDAQVKPGSYKSRTHDSCAIVVEKSSGEPGSVGISIAALRHSDNSAARRSLDEKCTPPATLDDDEKLLGRFSTGPAGDKMCGYTTQHQGRIGRIFVDANFQQETDVIHIRYSATGATESSAEQVVFRLAESIAEAVEE